jgi:hypothetical protein
MSVNIQCKIRKQCYLLFVWVSNLAPHTNGADIKDV